MRSVLILTLLVLLGALLRAEGPLPYPNEPAAGTEIVYPFDNTIMVWVPSGYFIMGMDRQDADKICKAFGAKDWEDAWAWEWFPQRKVFVPGFFIDKYEVTRDAWERYAAATGAKPMKGIAKGPKEDTPGDFGLYPATSVFWAEAAQYANWAGKALPYDAQWEKAARGTDGRVFPWGNAMPTPELGVFVDMVKKQTTMIQPVGSHPKGASPYGCLDMAGNVMEWTCEWMEPYQNNPEYTRMLSYAGHNYGSLRGGSFYSGPYGYICAKRFGFERDESYYHVGFRCAWTPPDDYFTNPAFNEAKAKVPARQAELGILRARCKPIPNGWIGG